MLWPVSRPALWPVSRRALWPVSRPCHPCVVAGLPTVPQTRLLQGRCDIVDRRTKRTDGGRRPAVAAGGTVGRPCHNCATMPQPVESVAQYQTATRLHYGCTAQFGSRGVGSPVSSTGCVNKYF